MSSQADRISDIRARAAAAMPGPWGWYGNVDSHIVHLATRHSGRQFIFDVTTRAVEYVYHHFYAETYTLAEARENVVDWFRGDPDMDCPDCGYPADEHSDSCREPHWQPEHPVQEAAREFLAEEIDLDDPSRHGSRDLIVDGDLLLTRAVVVHPELRFQRDGLMEPARDLARYEVLHGRTLAEHHAGGHPGSLYRADICGIDTPEAEFLAHARDDIDTLLAHIDELEAQLAAVQAPTAPNFTTT